MLPIAAESLSLPGVFYAGNFARKVEGEVMRCSGIAWAISHGQLLPLCYVFLKRRIFEKKEFFMALSCGYETICRFLI